MEDEPSESSHREEQYERLEKLYKRKCAVPHIGKLNDDRLLVYQFDNNIKICERI